MKKQNKNKPTENPLSLQIGNKIVMTCGLRRNETCKGTLLTNWKREFKGSEDRVAYVRTSKNELTLAVVVDDYEDHAEVGNGWNDGMTEEKLQILCRKFGCKPPYYKGDNIAVWYYLTNKKYNCNILKKPFHDIDGELGEEGDWLLYVKPFSVTGEKFKPVDMPKAYVFYNNDKKRWEFFDGYASKKLFMFQRSEIGKYVKVSSTEAYYLNMEGHMVTPSGEQYKMVSIYKVGRSKIYTYEWINAPKEVFDVVKKATCQFKTMATLEMIINWIESLKQTVNENK